MKTKSVVTFILMFSPVLLGGQLFAQLTDVTLPPGSSGENPTFITAAMQRPSGDRWLWSSEDPGGTKIFYNVLQDTDSDGLPNPGAWQFTNSQVAIDMGSGSVAVGTVLSSDFQIYRNPVDGADYSSVMYFVYQPTEDNGVIAGRLCLAFSNNLKFWTTPISAVFSHTGTSWSWCSAGDGEVMVEAVSAYHLKTNEIHLFYTEGLIAEYQNAIDLGTFETRSFTFFNKTTLGAPHVIDQQGEITDLGMFTPNKAGELNYKIFINLDVAYDAANGLLMINRVYPFPVDVEGSSIPCNSGGCATGIATFPNRAQGYCMNTSANIWKTLDHVGNSWTLEGDLGGPDGWSSFQGSMCSPTPLVDPVIQENVGLDFNSADFVKQPDGRLWRGNFGGVLKVVILLSGISDREAVCRGTSSEEFRLFELRAGYEDCAAAPPV